MNFLRVSLLFSKEFVYVPLIYFHFLTFTKNLFLQSLKQSGEQNILTNACNMKSKFPKNLGLHSFDCVKKSNLKCFLQLWCKQENNPITSTGGKTFSEYPGTAYVLQSAFILFCYGQFIICNYIC